jgi:hypothetical protein
MEEIYRFRRIKNLLGEHQELERQEIYFATPTQLNDPMEGYRDIYWQGDVIVWENFLNNYLRCVAQVFLLYLVVGESKKLDVNDLPLYPYALPNFVPQNEELLNKAKTTFFKNKFIKVLPKTLGERRTPIRRRELLSYLGFVHHYALNAVSDIYHQAGLCANRLFYHNLKDIDQMLSKVGFFAGLVNRMERENPTVQNIADLLFSVMDRVRKQTELAGKYNALDSKALGSNVSFLLMGFQDHFLDKLETLMYPNWFSASFLANCTNSAIWGHYAENHTGVCLIFSPTASDDGFQLQLRTEYGYSNAGPTIGMQPHTLRQVEYHNKHVAIDFFRSLGRGPGYQLNKLWYQNDKGEISVCAEHLKQGNDKAWHKTYWGNFFHSVSVKLEEWAYEEEYRLILQDSFIDYSVDNSRKLAYDFKDLKGLIFGMKTPVADKLAIIRIIREKCTHAKREGFDFYEAYYDQTTGKIGRQKLDLLIK